MTSNEPVRGSLTASGRLRPGPSISDVARLAGVSMMTVSRVANDSDLVRPATRDRVLAAMGELGYSPNHAARALRYGSFNAIGLLAHRKWGSGQSRTAEAIIEAARVVDYTVSQVEFDLPSSSDGAASARRLSSQAIDGLIIIRSESVNPDDLTLPSNLPVAVSDSRFIGHQPTVGADQVDSTRRAVRHLIELGHREIHHIAGPTDSDQAAMRLQGWREELAASGLAVPPVWQGDWSFASGYAMGQKLAELPSLTAVFCANDEMATGLMRALHERGISLPGEVSVVGFDDNPVSAYVWPPLTTVFHDFSRIGRELVDLLIRQMQDREDLTDARVFVPSPLVVRASTAPPGR